MVFPEKLGRVLEERKKLVDLIVKNAKLFVSESSFDKSVYYWRSNNFIQNTLSRHTVFDPSTEKWFHARGDSNGYQHVKTYAYERDMKVYHIFDNVSIPATSVITHEKLDCSCAGAVSFFINSTASVTVYVQLSPDGNNWFDLKSNADADRSWNCNNESICCQIVPCARYVRIVVYNAGSSTVTVNGWVACQV